MLALTRWMTLAGVAGVTLSLALQILLPVTGPHLGLRSFLLLLLLTPLVAGLPGLVAARPYTHAWISMAALFYFTIGVWNAAGSASRPWGIAEIIASLLLFIGAVLFTRLKARSLRDSAQ
ncbi:MAG: DUF2069 domain-containing protein [Gammaproteobacteria bacterium]|jgi:uncharacterized membrane protein